MSPINAINDLLGELRGTKSNAELIQKLAVP
jgi:hypothetical protein